VLVRSWVPCWSGVEAGLCGALLSAAVAWDVRQATWSTGWRRGQGPRWQGLECGVGATGGKGRQKGHWSTCWPSETSWWSPGIWGKVLARKVS
jgi:hypothetical protein